MPRTASYHSSSKYTVYFGKHRGKPFETVYEDFPDYCDYIIKVSSSSKAVRAFQAYCSDQQRIEDDRVFKRVKRKLWRVLSGGQGLSRVPWRLLEHPLVSCSPGPTDKGDYDPGRNSARSVVSNSSRVSVCDCDWPGCHHDWGPPPRGGASMHYES